MNRSFIARRLWSVNVCLAGAALLGACGSSSSAGDAATQNGATGTGGSGGQPTGTGGASGQTTGTGGGAGEHQHGGGSGGGSDLPSSTAIAAITTNALFVVNGGDSSLSVINTDTNQVTGTIQLANAAFPHHVYMNSDRSMLLVAIPGMDLSMGHGAAHAGHDVQGAVLMLDASNGSTMAAVRLPMMNHNAIFSPDESEIWTSQMMSPGMVLALDANTLAQKASIDVQDGPEEITFTADGKLAFVANGGSGSVSVIDPATKMVTKTVAVGDGPVGAWQGSNGVAYVDNETAMTLSAIDTKTLEVKLTYNLGFMPGMARLAPNGELWVTDSDNGQVVIQMADQDHVMGKIPTGAGAHGIAFSGDGKTAFISNQGADSVSVVDLTTHVVSATVPVGKKPNGMVWRAK